MATKGTRRRKGRNPDELRGKLSKLLPAGAAAELATYLEGLLEIEDEVQPPRKKARVRIGRRVRDPRKQALKRLGQALGALQQAIAQGEDEATAGLAERFERDFDESFTRAPGDRHFRQFLLYVDQAKEVVTRMQATSPGRPKLLLRDIVDREIVRAVSDAGLLKRTHRGKRSVLLQVCDVVYPVFGIAPMGDPTPGVRRASQNLRDVVVSGQSSAVVISECLPLTFSNSREK